jgi:glycerol-3-phosphate dehydrogenase (NAD(P)+)
MSYKVGLVIGGGAFGTSIATVMAKNFDKVIIKVRSDDVYQGLLKGENSVYLPGQKLASNIIPAKTWDEVDAAIAGNLELIVSGLPAAGITSFCSENFEKFSVYLETGVPVVSLSKGIDPDTLELSDDLFFRYFSNYKDQFTFLSGPSFAKEIVDEQITLVSLAGRSKKVLTTVADMLETPYFKIFPSYDVKGVLLGGALKNVLAIAGGIIEGLGFNHNTRAAMITRGIAEMLRFGIVYNARPETFYGLSGMGDLILTTTGELSRNKTFGFDIAKGKSPAEIIKSQRTVVEGYKTTKAAFLVAQKYDIRATIFTACYDVLYNNMSTQEVIRRLMKNRPTFE